MVVDVKDASQRVNILFTWHCDGKCPGCLFGRYVGKGRALDMPVRIAKRAVKGIGQFHEVCVAGGEPLSHPHFWKFIGWILAKNPATLTIVTNGNKFSGSRAGAKRWLSRFNKMAGKANASVQLIMSVGDFHAKGLKGGEAEMKLRISNVRQVLPKNAAFSFNFLAERAPKQSARAVILKYRLSKKRPQGPGKQGQKAAHCLKP